MKKKIAERKLGGEKLTKSTKFGFDKSKWKMKKHICSEKGLHKKSERRQK